MKKRYVTVISALLISASLTLVGAEAENTYEIDTLTEAIDALQKTEDLVEMTTLKEAIDTVEEELKHPKGLKKETQLFRAQEARQQRREKMQADQKKAREKNWKRNINTNLEDEPEEEEEVMEHHSYQYPPSLRAQAPHPRHPRQKMDYRQQLMEQQLMEQQLMKEKNLLSPEKFPNEYLLFKALKDCNLSGVQAALARKANPNHILTDATPLLLTTFLLNEADGTAIVQELLRAGASWDARNSLGKNILHLAVLSNNGDSLVQFLIQNYPRLLFMPDQNGTSPFDQAMIQFFSFPNDYTFNVIMNMIAHGARLTASSYSYEMPRGVFNTILNSIPINITNEKFLGPLLQTIHPNELNTVDRAGRTPLWFAAKHHNRAAVMILLELGADPQIPDVNGVTPANLLDEWGFMR